MEIYLVPVKLEKRDVLYRLLQYSLYEESAFDGNEMDETERFAWFICSEDGKKLLGFVMVNTFLQKAASGHSIAEFMVLPAYRRQGVGRTAARACFQMHPGTWEVSPSFGSEQAERFWRQVIEEYTGNSPRFEDGVFIF